MKPSITEFANFNESEWLKMLFLLCDTQEWLEAMQKNLLFSVPGDCKRKLFQKTYTISAIAFAHILERHYSKILRHPSTSKFTISVAEILHYLRQAADAPSTPVTGSLNYHRIIEADQPVGVDRNGEPTSVITVVTDAIGSIRTAFPGKLDKSRIDKLL